MRKFLYLFAAAAAMLLAAFSCQNRLPDTLGELPSSYMDYQGTQVHYKICAAAQHSTLPPIIFVHCWGCDMNAWQKQFPYFKEKAQMIFIDLPGFGLSGKPENTEYTLDYFAGSVNALLEELNISKPVLVGHSLGTAVCREVELKYPREGSKLVDVDGVYCFYPAPGSPESAEYDAAVQSFAHSFTPDKFDAAIRDFLSTLFIESTPEDVRDYAVNIMSATEQYVGAGVMENLIDRKYWDGTPIACPTLAIWSVFSGTPENYAEVLSPLYTDLECHEFENSGHFIMMEQPEAFNKMLAAFI